MRLVRYICISIISEKIRILRHNQWIIGARIDRGANEIGTFTEDFEIAFEFGYSESIQFMSQIILIIRSLKSVSSNPESQLVLDYKIPISFQNAAWSEAEKLVFGESLSYKEHVLHWSFRLTEDLVSGRRCKQLKLILAFSPTPNNVWVAVDKCISVFDSSDAVRQGHNLTGNDSEDNSASFQSGSELLSVSEDEGNGSFMTLVREDERDDQSDEYQDELIRRVDTPPIEISV